MAPKTVRIADASFRGGRAAWGAWIKGQGRQPILRCGACYAPTSSAAELQAIRLALTEAHRAGMLVGRVLILSDSLAALAEILRRVPGTETDGQGIPIPLASPERRTLKVYRPRLAAIRRTVAATGATLTLRHVRGHTPGQPGAWVNQAADILAGALTGRVFSGVFVPQALPESRFQFPEMYYSEPFAIPEM